MKILRIPIKVEASFFVLAVSLGLSRSRDLTLIAEWCAVVFVSVLGASHVIVDQKQGGVWVAVVGDEDSLEF